MLIGEYRHTIDNKKRVAVPASFRRLLGRKVVLTRGLDTCLFLYPIKSWRTITEKLSRLALGAADTRSFVRFFLAGAVESEVDSIGRILVPDFLKDFAQLKTKVVIAGVNDRVEIWNEDRWLAQTKEVERQADLLAEKLGEIGVF
ncbi:MAG: division/cell wall cluster transcriptional repressor MraZ [Candidatus Vogelbacteria bacterium]|nr:division/cell wall cluster transcriptional repressor MraZ [Candidatus Vogelbacteria bacterium]